jgi:hypothetical protein
MSTPTISTAGATSGLLLITDHEGTISRVPKTAVCDVVDSSSSDVYRVEVCHAHGAIILIFASAAEVTAALNAIDAQY